MSKAVLTTLETRARENRVPHDSDAAAKSRVEFQVETITPATAKQYLEKRLAGRNGDARASAAYAEAMRIKAWVVNGMPIVFDRDGVLLDGVVRLEACILADTPFTTVVARNVRRDTLHTIDQHRRRSYQGVLEARGERNAGALIRLMGKLIRIENGTLGLDNMQISWTRYDQVLDANPVLREAIQLSLDTKAAKLHSTARHVLVYMALAAEKKPELRQFLASITEPDAYPLDHPGRVLSMQLEMFKDTANEAMDVDQALALGILAFEAVRSKKSVNKAFAWKPSYGKAKLNEAGRPINRKERSKAPRNMGLPTMEGYPGLEAAKFDLQGGEEMAGPLAQSLRTGVSTADGITIKAMTVTPELAREWLQKYNRGNRSLQQSHVSNIVRDILSGHWMFNAQPICFGTDGRLLNGQHRLHACVDADSPIDVVIVEGISDAAFSTYDIHAKKTVALSGGTDKTDPRVIAAAAKIQWRVDNDIAPGATSIKPTAAELQETLEKHPAMAEGFSRARRMIKIGSAAVMTFLLFYVRYQRPDIAEEFLDQLETGEQLNRDNPLLRVRNGLLAQRSDDKRRDRLVTLLEAWEAYKVFRDQSASLLN